MTKEENECKFLLHAISGKQILPGPIGQGGIQCGHSPGGKHAVGSSEPSPPGRAPHRISLVICIISA